MTLPNAVYATIEPRKVHDYLLSAAHPVGRFKAVVFAAAGYSAEHWELLRDDLLALARAGQAVPGQSSEFGRKFELDGVLVGPSGRSLLVRTVWMLDTPTSFPRFVTAIPR